MQKHSNIDKAKFQVVTKEPFFAALLMSMKVEYVEYLPDGSWLWLAATDGSTLYFNPEECNKLPTDQIVGLIIHELYHVALMHPFRRNGRDPGDWNTANDYIINDNVVSSGYAIPDGGVYDPQMNARQYSSEQLYDMIHVDKPDEGGGQGEDKSGEGDGEGDDQSGGGKEAPSGGSKGDPLAGDILEPEGDKQEAEKEAAEMVVQAAQIGKAMGRLPSEIAEKLHELLNPRKSWKEELLEFCNEIDDSDYSFARPNRRFVSAGLYLPGKHGEEAMGQLCVIIDTSGSVSDREIQRFCSELIGAVEDTCPRTLVVIYCDTRVSHAVELDEPSAEDVKENVGRFGGGGTDMTVGLDYVQEQYPDAAAAVVFTDGGTPFGNPREFPVLWAMTTETEAPHGRTIQVEV